ncbi:MAG: NAD-binding protein [Planctomycetota bacterium]|nr:NAD-binding protein [Planctomycetota bacterium]
MKTYWRARMRTFVTCNRTLLGVLIMWFMVAYLVFIVFLGIDPLRALGHTFYSLEAGDPFSNFYREWGPNIVLGVLIGIIFQNVFDKSFPERSCRLMAKEMKDHVVVIGCSHFGRRMVDYLKKTGKPFVLVEHDRNVVDDLLRAGLPIVIDDATQDDALDDASVATASLVIVTVDNLEAELIVTRKVRMRNKTAPLLVRCYRDEFVDILETLGATRILSSSKSLLDQVIAEQKL